MHFEEVDEPLGKNTARVLGEATVLMAGASEKSMTEPAVLSNET